MCDWQMVGVILFVIFIVILFALIIMILPERAEAPCERREADQLYIKLVFITLWLVIIGVTIGIVSGRMESCSLGIVFWLVLIFLIFLH